MPTSNRLKLAAQDRIIEAIEAKAAEAGASDAELAKAIREQGTKLAERWGAGPLRSVKA